MRALHSMDKNRDRPALYVVGALRGEEAREFEAHLKQGCEVCSAEVKALARVSEALDRSVPPQPTSAKLRERVLAKIASEARSRTAAMIDRDGVRFMFPNLMSWQGTIFNGIEAKIL